MKRPSREFNIFSMSALDLFASALGVFILIAVVLFPYYLKNEDAIKQVRQLQQQLEQSQQQLANCEQQQQQTKAQLTECEKKSQECERILAQPFWLAYISWNTKDDVDMHIIDPSGAEFSFSHKTISGRPGNLSVDNTSGPGNEVWEIRGAHPGKYKIYAKWYNKKGNSAPTIKGRVIHRDDGYDMPTKRLSRVGRKVLMATVSVAADGAVSVR
ncbi:MAG: hypothetical protein R8L53_06075 [Mariprofundales bacterium]